MMYKELCGEKLSRLGMGNMRLPTIDGRNGPIDEAKAQEIIDYLMAAGVNYYDTAYMYHGGKSEIFVGKALSKYPRDRYFLADKMPSYPLEEGRTPQEIFEEQLQKCGTDHFDFYLLHNLCEDSVPVFTDPKKGVIPYLLEQKKNGRIRHFGLSSHAKPETLKAFLDQYDFFEFVQLQLNYLDWEMQDAKQQYEIVTDYGVPVWVMEPCRGGRLASLTPEADKLLTDCDPGRSVASWAFRYVMSLPNVGVILSGMTQMDQAENNVETFSEGKHLTEQEQAVLNQALEQFRSQVIVPCTACHYCDGCPMELEIPDILKLYNRYSLSKSSMIHMDVAELAHGPADCIGCGACESKCPQHIAIPEIMAKFAEGLKTLPKPKMNP